jgi:hypothetical protein
LPIAMQSPTASNASGVASNARCRATRGRSRKGCIAQGGVLHPRGATKLGQGKQSVLRGNNLASGSIHGGSKRSILASLP